MTSQPSSLTLPLRADELIARIDLELSMFPLEAQAQWAYDNRHTRAHAALRDARAYLVSCVEQESLFNAYKQDSELLDQLEAEYGDIRDGAQQRAKELATRVDTLNSAIQPTGSTAASNEAAPTDWPRAEWIATHLDRGHTVYKRDSYVECSCGDTWSKYRLDLAAVLPLGHREGWRPIAEAPKDGTEVLLTDGHFKRTGWWASRINKWSVDTAVSLAMPTHWAPLPADPPSSQRSET